MAETTRPAARHSERPCDMAISSPLAALPGPSTIMTGDRPDVIGDEAYRDLRTERRLQGPRAMTTRELNDFLTLTGPGTPMGQLFRRYWIPALMSAELPEPDCPPVRVKLLSERLIAFRDSQGRVGLMDEFCAHRGVSLWFGRNEENGLRCPYHGWKYDVTGQCIDVPSEPIESGFCQKIKLKSYECVQLGDVIWAYMGPP